MIDTLRQDIYNYLDQNGIPGSHVGSISLHIDLGDESEPSYSRQKLFIPNLSKFGLSECASEQIVIEYIYHTTNVRISGAADLIKMKNLDNKPFFLLLNEHENKIKYCLAFGKIPGSTILRGSDKIKSLGNIEEIFGDLGFSESTIEDLGNLKKVHGSLWIAQGARSFTKLKSLQGLEYVGGDLNIKNSPIIDLGNLNHVGGNLNLRQTFVEKLNNVKFIGGNLLLPKELKGKLDTSRVKIIGKIKYYDDRSLDDIL